MWIFRAYYTNMVTGEERAISIEFEDLFDSEKEAYLYAMGRAIDKKNKQECLGLVEFIAC